MKHVILFTFLCLASISQATTYYISSTTGDDSRTPLQATNPSTPWRSLQKVTDFNLSLKPGDSVLFKRGESFFGSLSIRSSGMSGNQVYYGAWGTGSNPLITGFTTLTNWVQHSGSIYYATLNVANLNIVSMNGAAKAMGRYPNTGMLKYEGNSGNTSIIDHELPSSPNWTGAEVVVRKYRFILDRHKVTSHSGTTLAYSTSQDNGNNSAFSPVKNNGYFIQNHLGTLDQQGEWYFDQVAKRLYMHFGGSQPSSFVVKASARDFNTFVTTANHVKMENLDFEGGNAKGLWLTSSSNVLIQNCNFSNQGGSAVYAVDVSRITLRGGTVNTSFSNGVNFEHNANYCTVDGVAVSNTNMIPGTGRSGSGISDGIVVAGNYSVISNNRVINSGYNGIAFQGDNVLIERNYIDTFCTIKDDGGGIYTYIGESQATSYNRKIRNNIILNAIGARVGTDAYAYEAHGKGAGIYLDEYVNNVEVTGNTIANGDWAGIFMHNAHTSQITNNIIFNHRYLMHVSQYTAATRNMTQTGNQYIAKQPTQEVWYYRTFVSDNPTNMGVSNNNYFARPIDDNKVIHCDFYQSGGAGTQHYTLDQWKTAFRLDGSSLKSPITYKANINDSMRFEFNASASPKVVSLDGGYLDVTGAQYPGSVTLQPFTSVVLLRSRIALTKQSQVINFPVIGSKSSGSAPFALAATASSGLPVSYRVVSGPATLSGNMLTLTGTGTVSVEAMQAGNTTYNAATPVTQSFAVSAATLQSQTISFPAISNKTFGNAPFTLNAYASSGLTVNYRVVSGPATVSGNTVTMTAAGTVTIEATQPGNATYKAASPVTQTFTVVSSTTSTAVGQTAQTISFGSLSYKTFGTAPFTLSATASSGLPVVFRVVSGPATVSGNTVTVTGVGSVSIQASQAGNSTFAAATPVVRSFSVGKASQAITFASLPNRTFGDASFSLTATASSGLRVAYRVVSGPATVSGATVTLTGAGTVTIEAMQAGNINYNAAYDVQRTFTVSTSSALTSTTSTNRTEMLPEVTSGITVYPNPVTTEASVSITAATTVVGVVEIFNMQGVLKQRLASRTFEKGVPVIIRISASGYTSGIYIVRMTSAAGVITQRFEVMR
jgi:parallel beta-helix repeat protein